LVCSPVFGRGPLEVASIAPHCIVSIQPLFHPNKKAKQEYTMFQNFQKRYEWVLPIYQYQDIEDLLASLKIHVIKPAEQKARELKDKK